MSHVRHSYRVAVVVLSVAAAWHAGRAPADENQQLFRYDPIAEDASEITADELRSGYIYKHFDERLDRYVWSYYLGDGNFWRGLGPGSVEEGNRFDLQGTIDDMRQRAQEANPQLLDQYERRRRSLRFRLQNDNQWELLPGDAIRQVHDLETGYRWEEHGRQFVPVRHGGGYRWTYRDRRFVPAGF